MKTMVFDVPAESGGALTILNQYYDAVIKDTDTEWIFVVSTPRLKDHQNIKILNYPWVKKSWFHRLYFDRFVAHKLVKKYEVDEVLSLQNVIVPHVKVKQILYLHQSLPFVEKKFSITENFKFWIYQNIISKKIFKSIKEADKVIVQTRWMKEACLKKVKTDSKKFEVSYPNININIKKMYRQENNNFKTFFYPASGGEYKNHKIIIEATKKLVDLNIINFKVIFTLKGDESKHIKTLYQKVKNYNLPIDFIGQISLEDVYDYYSKSILIFPSYIETFGLPMLEARLHNSPILASGCVFSHEVLNDYNRVEFFNPFSNRELTEKMMFLIQNDF